jgi:hypothetical protein
MALPLQAAADALSDYDDAITSSEVMEDCHLAIDGGLSNTKMRLAGEAAFEQVGGSADRSRPESDAKADFALKKRTELDLDHGRKIVAEQGCDLLAPHARKVLESYRKQGHECPLRHGLSGFWPIRPDSPISIG